jgi:hypothetical protein
MDTERLSVKKFHRYFLFGQLVSVVLIILGFTFTDGKQDKILQITGWLFLAMGFVFIFIINGRKARLLWIYKNTSPTSMKMVLEKIDGSDSTAYVAYLTREDKSISERWETELYPPACNVQLHLNNEIQVLVFVDPKNNHPAVIRTAEGLLWIMAGSGAVQNLHRSQ